MGMWISLPSRTVDQTLGSDPPEDLKRGRE
jgi:hypothetical protein